METANVCMTPINKEATKAPLRDPNPPTTITTKTIGPNIKAIAGSVPRVFPANTPANPANPHPKPKTIMKTLGTLCPNAETVSGCVKAALIISPALVLVNTANKPAKIKTETVKTNI